MSDERARAASVAQNERLYEQAARLARIGAWECDLATERLSWTSGVYDLFELAVDTPLKRSSIVDLYFDESRRQMETMRAEAIRSGRGFVIDVRIRTNRRNRRWMRLSADVASQDGRPVRLFGTKQDVTDEKEA